MARLVEILARELKEWPEKAGNTCSQDPDREARFESSRFDFYLSELADDSAKGNDYGGGVEVTRAEWQAAVDALNKPDVAEWDGVGLPPVGTVCEFTHNGEGVEGRWVSCTILAYGSRGDFGETVAIQTNDELFKDRGGLSIQSNRQAISWRPIRTPEQIAAEEIEEVAASIGIAGDSIRLLAKALTKAGYRKQEPK